MQTIINERNVCVQSADSLEPPQELLIKSLQAHPLNKELYDDGLDQGLLESVGEHGVLTPLLVTAQGVIVSGHRRWKSAMQAGLKTVPANVIDVISPADVERVLLEANVQRVKKTEEILREYRRYLALERPAAKERQGNRTDLVENFPPCSGGKSRDVAAEKVGLSGKTAEKGLKILEAIEGRVVSEDTDAVKEIRSLLNEKSVNAAYEEAVRIGWIAAPSRAPSTSAECRGTKPRVAPETPSPQEDLLLFSEAVSREQPATAMSEAQPAKTTLEPAALEAPFPEHSRADGQETPDPGEDDLLEPDQVMPSLPEMTAAPSSYREWISADLVRERLETLRRQNQTAAEQLTLTEEGLIRIEGLTTELCSVVNGALAAASPDIEMQRAVEAVEWVARELKRHDHC